MLFNSFQFALFFPAVVALFFLTPQRFRWILLLGASYYFYACWRVEYLGLIVLSTVIDYTAGVMMGRKETKAERRPYLILSLISNLGILFAFKYFNFFSTSLNAAFAQFNIFYDATLFDVLLPIGISFYTFQTLAYSIDVYRGMQEPEKHLGMFALYVSFFPQLVAGPIERSQRLLPQFRKAQEFDYRRVVDGLKLMLWGFFKKLVIADRLAVFVNEVYNNPGVYEGDAVLLASYFFAFQIYCDFSGYSDIAIGSAQVMGYDLMENFRRPYFSKSISEFWKRWHISLSTWFRDYLYIPLGGNRVSKARWYFNLFFVFLVSGLWHGAAWTFVIWGALHGIYLIASILTAGVRERIWSAIDDALSSGEPTYRTSGLATGFANVTYLRRVVAVFTTFHLVLLGWIFFRANSIGDAFTFLGDIAQWGSSLPELIQSAGGMDELAVALGAIAFMEFIHLAERRRDMRHFLSQRSAPVRWSVYIGLSLAIILFGVFRQQEFIYFQF